MTKDFWKAALNRAVRTIAQTTLAMIGTATLIQQLDWYMIGGTALLAGLVSILTSITTGLPEVTKNTDKE